MGSHAVSAWQLVAVLTALGGVFSVYLGTVIRHRDHPVAHDLGWFTTFVGFWATATAGALLSPSAALGSVLWERVVPILTFAWIPYWVLFSVRYVGHDTFSSVRRRALLFLPVVVLAATALSPLATPLVFEELTYVRWNGLFVREFRPGVVYTATNVFRYIGGATGALVMAQFLQNSRNIYRRQTALILAVPLIGMAGGILFQVGLSPHPGIKLPPLLVTVQAPLLALVVFKYEFLNLKPVAPDRAIEEMLDPVVVVDDDHALVDFNPAAAETFGFTDDCYGEPIESLVDAATGTLSLEDVGFGGTQTDGGVAPVFDSNRAPIRDQYGRDKGSVLVFRNITELKQREQALERQNERLDKFAAMVSHDLRNPMSVAHGNLELARETGAAERFDATEQALARMDEIIDDMLTIARADRRVDDPASVSPAEIAHEGWTTVGADGAALTLDIPDEYRIEASATLLQTLFENLFRNAVDHNDPPVTVTVGLLDGSKSGLYVADDGKGIPAAQQETVFDHGVSTGGDGAGIGLAIVAEIVDSHGWDITVTASETGGTRFEIRT